MRMYSIPLVPVRGLAFRFVAVSQVRWFAERIVTAPETSRWLMVAGVYVMRASSGAPHVDLFGGMFSPLPLSICDGSIAMLDATMPIDPGDVLTLDLVCRHPRQAQPMIGVYGYDTPRGRPRPQRSPIPSDEVGRGMTPLEATLAAMGLPTDRATVEGFAGAIRMSQNLPRKGEP